MDSEQRVLTLQKDGTPNHDSIALNSRSGLESRQRQYDTSSAERQQYRNSLLWQVGLLELTNALDFPANIWNQIPTPLFAAVLMGVGGSIAILWSIFPFWDMHKSLANIGLLRQERRFLKRWQQEFDDTNTLETRALVQAWLDVNFRELGWECIDRVMLDICAGVSGILVGTGALMAIRGDIDEVFQASNLLSGYIGNSFLAPFALLNSFWAVFMWMRAGGERKMLTRGQTRVDPELQIKMRHHGRRHRWYAVVNGLTAVIGCIGSIMSATLWYGYVIIAPCVFTSVYANLLWRHRMGYDRHMIWHKEDLTQVDIRRRAQAILTTLRALDTGQLEQLPCFQSEDKVAASVVKLFTDLGLSYELHWLLAGRSIQETSQQMQDESVALNQESLALRDNDAIVKLATEAIVSNRKQLQYQERFYIELYGRYYRSLDEQVLPDKEDIASE